MTRSPRFVWYVGDVSVLDVRSVQVKHLPGRHDQQRHDPHKGTAGTPVTAEWFNDGGSKYVQELSSEHKQAVIDALTHYDITQEDLEGVSKITTTPPEGYVYVGAGVMYRQDDGKFVNGSYNPNTKVITISKAYLADPIGAKTLLHEIGHHVAEGQGDVRSKKMRADIAHGQLKHITRGDPIKLIDYGLRENSVKDSWEFMADVYIADRAANVVQRRNLENFFADIGIDSIEAVYKEFGIRVPVKEIQATRTADGLIEFTSVPVEVDPAVLAAVPWYYITSDVLKHQPGRHDQQRHAGTRGRIGDGAVMRVRNDVSSGDYVDQAMLDLFMEDVEGGELDKYRLTASKLTVFPEGSYSKYTQQVSEDVAERTGLAEDDVKNVLGYWNGSVAEQMRSEYYGMKRGIAEEFGLENTLPEWFGENERKTLASGASQWRYDYARDVSKVAARAMYEETQRRLARAGIKEVTVYRGHVSKASRGQKAGDVVDVASTAASSWTLDPSVAERFADDDYTLDASNAGIVLQTTVPASRILSYYQTGFGTGVEAEIVVLEDPEATDQALVTKRYARDEG